MESTHTEATPDRRAEDDRDFGITRFMDALLRDLYNSIVVRTIEKKKTTFSQRSNDVTLKQVHK